MIHKPTSGTNVYVMGNGENSVSYKNLATSMDKLTTSFKSNSSAPVLRLSDGVYAKRSSDSKTYYWYGDSALGSLNHSEYIYYFLAFV